MAAAAEAAGVVVVSRPNSPMKLKQPRFSRPPSASGRWSGGHHSANVGVGNGSGVSDDGATAGAGATALSAWRSVARRARAVAALAAAGGDPAVAGAAAAALPDVDEWRRVCIT